VRTSSFVTLDDDPTGTQAMRGVPLVLDWSGGALERALADGAPAVHMLTNTRALPAREAFAQTRAAAAAALAAAPRAHLLLRGDSTLRAHFREEAEALAEVAYPGATPIVVVAPSLPAAGRVTCGGVHYVDQPSGRQPIATTEYASDGVFSYASSRLLDWAEERSYGLFRASDGGEVHLAALRARGGAQVEHQIDQLASRGVPCVLAIDAENDDDVALAAEGLNAALRAGLPLVIRCSPAFAAAIEGNWSQSLEPPPSGGAGTLVICGSYVEASTRQLATLARARPGSLVTVDVVRLAGGSAEGEIDRVARASTELIAKSGLAVVATPRQRPSGLMDLASGARIAGGLAGVVAQMQPRPGVVISKGGITSAVVARHGLAAELAQVIGPIASGVALWRCNGQALIVVPGNVGDENLLSEIVQLVEDSL
jgi:uncharacterized protein YgbK (DUF1537 family)